MTATRTFNGVDLPAPGVWAVDAGHAEVAFIGRHLGLTKIRGRFVGVDGTVRIAEAIEDSTVEVTIDMASVDSGDTARDDHLRSDDFFDVANHPEATFRSIGLSSNGTEATLTGELTIKGVSGLVDLAVEYVGQATDPWGGERAVFHAATKINREDWGLTWNMLLDSGSLLVSREIRLEVDVELIRQSA